MMKFHPISVVLFLYSTLVSITAAQASSFGQQVNPLQVSGGIAMPATSTSVFTNPAGLVGANKALVLQAAAPEVWDNGTYRGGLQGGGSSFGLAAGVQDRNQNPSNALDAYYGLAVGNQAFSLGLAGKTGVSNSSGSTFNAGLLFGVGSNAKIGVTATNISNGVNEWGAGIAFGVASGVDLVLDTAANSNLKGLEAKPGIKVSGGEAALTMSYATGARQQFADGFSAGASLKLSANGSLEIQYNAGGDLSKYFAALTLGF